MQIHSVGIDLGKTTFNLVALGAAGKVLVKKKFNAAPATDVHREHADFADRLGSLFRRALSGTGIAEVRSRCTADRGPVREALREVQYERKNMRFVPIKTDDQLDLQAIHRVRDRLISRRTAVINQLRAFLLERGMVFAQTPAKLKAAMVDEWAWIYAVDARLRF
jgi:transposase